MRRSNSWVRNDYYWQKSSTGNYIAKRQIELYLKLRGVPSTSDMGSTADTMEVDYEHLGK